MNAKCESAGVISVDFSLELIVHTDISLMQKKLGKNEEERTIRGNRIVQLF
ncbi:MULTISPECIES: hypothetical protein [unclassified Sedimentibacter]|uniref:hypothetical protein n=1 Tax=unclassified Sedimentibacter TaxID=2649220 RepID=UPI0027E164D2|nr:hypothetical protein [Sedimentibacter sp. MB35-C1]WMJ77493.1 hypothetical protein RBQ61_00760 [Sedimentibacter sp. MB35-C1]